MLHAVGFEALPALLDLMHKFGPQLVRRVRLVTFLSSHTLNTQPSVYRSSLFTSSCLGQHEPTGNTDTASSSAPEHSEEPVADEVSKPKPPDDAPITQEDGDPGPSKPKDKSSYGSGSKRAMRNLTSKQPKDPPRPQLPQWFLETRVHLREEQDIPTSIERNRVLHPDDRLKFKKTRSETSLEKDFSTSEGKKLEEQRNVNSSAGLATPESEEKPHYEINETVWQELSSLVSAGLQVPMSMPNLSLTSTKPHVLLQCPQTGSAGYLDGLVDILAASNDADRISIDSQDLEEASMEYLAGDEDLRGKLRNLSYEAYRSSLEPRETSENDENEEDADDSGEETEPHFSRSFSIPKLQNLRIIPKMIASIVIDGQTPATFPGSYPRNDAPTPESESAVRAAFLADAFLEAGDAKRSMLTDKKEIDGLNPRTAEKTDDERAPTYTQGSPVSHKRTIIAIKEYLGIKSTPFGALALAKLQEAVEKRRNEGHQILIIGKSTGASGLPLLSKSGVQNIQTDIHSGPFRTIVMPCFTPATTEDIFADDKKTQVLHINLRNLRIMLVSMCPNRETVKAILHTPSTVYFKQSQLYASYLDEKIWPQHQIHRWATVMIGIANDQVITPAHVEQALALVLASDEIKFEWVEEERKRIKELRSRSSNDPSSTVPTEERMDKIKKDCNTYEKKLLSGVVDPGAIRVTFNDVRAEASTIDTLRMLTTLSLVRPDAFTYGVLATERIPGMLLYGPPGVGKTLLAKAVAKESGATVLEVDGSTVYDMYVGEGEKNVKAIFSLAKKLTPCIIFIDEADAILGTRTGSANRTSHRELINQFLREWDGMNETSAFIMVATNRPFDLDEACLRRLPRRVLVDLPTVKDREAILKIHLKDEALSSEVSIAKLAAHTPLYSGSDLKNLSVAAALRCVREEIENGADTHSDRRTLYQRHFDRALEEISASISEDMSSLSAIRKFDEKYGDRTGKKKKIGSYGFGTIKEGEKKLSDLARVRNQPA